MGPAGEEMGNIRAAVAPTMRQPSVSSRTSRPQGSRWSVNGWGGEGGVMGRRRRERADTGWGRADSDAGLASTNADLVGQFHLGLMETVVGAVACEQFVVRADFDQFSRRDDRDSVGLAERA